MRILPRTRRGWLIVIAAVAVVLLTAVAWFVGVPWLRYRDYEPQEGDIVFQSFPKFDLVFAIEGITGSPYSHCGVVVREDGSWYVLEAVDKVRKTPLFAWVMRGRGGGKFAVFRLRPGAREHIPRFLDELKTFLGRPYDFHYRLDDEPVYCSEVPWRAWKSATGGELGELKTLGEMNWKPYESTIRRWEQGELPLDRKMITPKDLAEAPELEKVFGGDF